MLVVHALALVAVGFCAVMGFWQWDRAQDSRSAQNLFYAIEWWAFAAIMAFVWWRTVQDELTPSPHPDAPLGEDGRVAAPVTTAAEDDPELQAYNDYLAWLAANPRD